MKSLAAIIGALLFGLGGSTVVSIFWYASRSSGMSAEGVPVFSFIGFLLMGLGLLLIVQEAKPETKQNLQ